MRLALQILLAIGLAASFVRAQPAELSPLEQGVERQPIEQAFAAVGTQVDVQFVLEPGETWADVEAGPVPGGMSFWKMVHLLSKQSGYEPIGVSRNQVVLRRVDVPAEEVVRPAMVAGARDEVMVRVAGKYPALVDRGIERAQLLVRTVTTKLSLHVLIDPRLVDDTVYVSASAFKGEAIYPLPDGRRLESELRLSRGVDPATPLRNGIAPLDLTLEAGGMFGMGTPGEIESFRVLVRVVHGDIEPVTLRPGEPTTHGRWHLELSPAGETGPLVRVPRGQTATGDWMQMYHVLQRGRLAIDGEPATGAILIGPADPAEAERAAEQKTTPLAARYEFWFGGSVDPSADVTMELPRDWDERRIPLRWDEPIAVALPVRPATQPTTRPVAEQE